MRHWTTAPRMTAGALLLGALLTSCAGGGDGGETASSSDDDTATTRSSTLELTVPKAPTGRCMLPNVESLRAQDTAFEGVVTEVGGTSATVEVTDSWKGPKVDVVTVVAPAEPLRDLLLAVDFERGRTYLVSSLEGQVSVCGLSGPKDDALTELYEQAYRG